MSRRSSNMMSHIAFGFLLFAGTALAKAKDPRIVGGAETSIEEYPQLVQVEMFSQWQGLWSQGCGANILTPSWIMSAAHCFEGRTYSPRLRRVRAGTSYRNSGGEIHYIDFERNHPDYRKAARYDADINVVKLSTPLVFSPVIQKGTIVVADFDLPDNLPVLHAGWGDLTYGGRPPRILHHVEMYTINNQLCTDRYKQIKGVVTPNMICAGLLDIGGRDACQGDSGGPLYAGSNKVIVGVVSWGYKCANATYPGISTRVASYTKWVNDNAR